MHAWNRNSTVADVIAENANALCFEAPADCDIQVKVLKSQEKS